jgi:transposase
VKKVIEKLEVNMHQLPVNSPDLNPVESMWCVVKGRLGKMECSTKERLGLISNIKKHRFMMMK